MKEKIRELILNCPFAREVFFFLKQKKVNKHAINRKILRLKTDELATKQIPVIVSLTSYGKRLEELQYTLYSLVDQSIKPEKIVVNLAKDDFESVPEKLRLFGQYGVLFTQTEDLRSYKKLIPSLMRYPDTIIVTADDDLYYPKDWLEKLWKGHKQYPGCIVCHLTKNVSFSGGKIAPYNSQKYNTGFVAPSYRNFILSGGGTLFPAKCLHSDVSKTELFMKLCPHADDVWDYFMAVLNGTKIMQIPHSYTNVKYVNPYREYGLESGETLAKINVDENLNDTQFNAVLSYYGLSQEDFINFLSSETGRCKQ